MFKYLFVCVFLVKYIVVPCNGARILAVFPTPSISHQVVFRPLTQELAKRGHELVILTPDPVFTDSPAPPNLTEIDLHDISYNHFREHFTKQVQGNTDDAYKILELIFTVMNDVLELQIETPEFQELIKNNSHFDLIFTEAFIRPALVMSHVFKAPVIQISSFGSVPPNLQTVGAPSHPIFYPDCARKRIYNLTLWEKIYGIYEDVQFKLLEWRLEEGENRLIKKHFGADAPTVSELSDNVDMLFLNVDHMWDANRPAPPGVLYLGGLHQKPHKELPKDLKVYLDSSKHGVIYMSFGTNVDPSQLPPERIQVFTKVFAGLPYDVLWKWNQDELPGRPDNVRISKWLPQSDLLRHPKIKLFITQAGLQSSDEAISAGVPLIAFPVWGDQWYNAEKYVHHGLGLKMDLENVSEDSLAEAIQDVIRDDKYRSNVLRLGALRRDRPASGLDRAVWWTEHVLRHRGAKHLRAAAANVSWARFLALDALAAAGLAALTLATVVLLLVKYACGALFRSSAKLKRS